MATPRRQAVNGWNPDFSRAVTVAVRGLLLFDNSVAGGKS